MRNDRYASALAQILAVLGPLACGGTTDATKSTSGPGQDAGVDAQGGSGVGGANAGSGGTGGAIVVGVGGIGGAGGAGSGGSGGTYDALPDGAPPCIADVIARRSALPRLPDGPGKACGIDAATPHTWEYLCFEPPADGGSCASTYETECVQRLLPCGLSGRADVLCGPLPPLEGLGVDPRACCYVLTNTCPVGRPFLVEGKARLAPAAEGEGWRTHVAPDTAALDPESRKALADLYRQDALSEHASVASFARFVLQCLGLGAPADIVLEAQRAGLEEVEHARLSFGLASAYSGRPERALALDVTGALENSLDARAVALGVAREGCIAETVSALLIAAARDQAEDPAVRRVLTQVAEQELRHAQLAWRYLAWALDHGDRTLRRAIAAVFMQPEREVGLGPETSFPGDARALRAHGWLPIDERRSIALAALREVVMPAARVLLATYSAVDPPRAASAAEHLDPAT